MNEILSRREVIKQQALTVLFDGQYKKIEQFHTDIFSSPKYTELKWGIGIFLFLLAAIMIFS